MLFLNGEYWGIYWLNEKYDARYLDYYAVMLFIGRNGDWPSGNYALWRVKMRESGDYGDGKWRWMLFDLNSPAFDIRFDSIEYTMENDQRFFNDDSLAVFAIEMEELNNFFAERMTYLDPILKGYE